MLMTWVSCFQSIRMEHTWSRSSSVSRAGALKDPVLTLLFYVRVVPPVALSLARLDLYYCSSVKAWWSAAQRGAAGPRSVTDRNRSLVSLSCSGHLDGSPHFRRPRNQFFISSKKFDSDFQDIFVKRGRLQLISVTVYHFQKRLQGGRHCLELPRPWGRPHPHARRRGRDAHDQGGPKTAGQGQETCQSVSMGTARDLGLWPFGLQHWVLRDDAFRWRRCWERCCMVLLVTVVSVHTDTFYSLIKSFHKKKNQLLWI